MSIAENLAQVRAQIAEACGRANRSPGEVALMAVSKVHPVACLVDAYDAGQRLFGENKVQEWEQKAATAASLEGLEMHLIGPLQSNKTARAAELFQSIDTVDSVRIAQRLNETARSLGKRLPVYVEVKLSHEAAKHGVAPGGPGWVARGAGAAGVAGAGRADDGAAVAGGCGACG